MWHASGRNDILPSSGAGLGAGDSHRPLVAITDSCALGEAICRLALLGCGCGASAFHLEYQTHYPFLSRELIDEAGLFVLELYRRYSYGIRAEGVAVAEKLSAMEARFLVLAPTRMAGRVASRAYWDLAAGESLAERIKALRREDIDFPSEVTRLKTFFGDETMTPRAH